MSDLSGPLIAAHVTLVLTTYVIGGLVIRGSNFRVWFDELDIPYVPTNGYFYAISWFVLYGIQIAARTMTFNNILPVTTTTAIGVPLGVTDGFSIDGGGIVALSTLYCAETFLNILWAPLFFLLQMEALSVVVVLLDAVVSMAAAVVAFQHGCPVIGALLLAYSLFLLLALGFTVSTMWAKEKAGVGGPSYTLLPTHEKAKSKEKTTPKPKPKPKPKQQISYGHDDPYGY
jgi:tryptophan-rich sensory protein